MKWLLHLIILFILIFPLKAEAESPIKEGDMLDIRRCVELAVKNHPSINAAQGNIKVSESKVEQAKSNYYPQIGWNTSYSRFSSSASSSDNRYSRSGEYNQYNSNLTLTQNIFDFQKTATQVQIQNINTESSRHDLNTTEAQVILGAKQAYYTLVQTDKNKEVALENVKQFESHLEQAKGFFEVGVKPKFDVTKAEVDLSSAKLNLIKAENAFRIARVNLNNAIGVPNAPQYIVDSTLLFEKYDVDVAEASKKAYNNRTDLQSMVLKVEAGNQAIELAKKNYYPNLTGNASFGYQGDDLPLDRNWSVGAVLNVPIFSGFLTKNQVAEAKANLEVLKANEQSLRQQIRLEVEQVHSNLLEATDGIAVAQLLVRQAEENLELANGRYAAGVGNPVEVTDALVALSNAKMSHIAALTGFKTAQASLEKAMGVK